MANSVLDLSAFADNFARKNLLDINELVAEKGVEISELPKVATIYDDVVFNQDFGFIGENGFIGSKGFSTGADIEDDNFSVKGRRVTFTPSQWGGRLAIDYSTFANTCAIYAMNKGCRIADLTDTDVMDVIINVVAKGLERFKWRLFFFNDTEITASTTGDLKEGEEVKYWNIIDGFLKQIKTQINTNASQKVSITKTSGKIKDISTVLSDMYYGANMSLRGMDDKIIVCTQSFADAYAQKLSSTGELESMLRNYQDGVARLTYQGIELVPVMMFDDLLAHFNDTVKKDFAIFTSKQVLGCAMDSMQSFENFNIWYDNYRRTVYVDVAGRADCQLMNPELFMYAE